jgi:hypothetical protein
MRATALLLVLLAACASPGPRPLVSPLERARGAVSLERLRRTITELAADEMKGRKTGTPEALRAAERIAEWMGEAGLRPVGPEGFLLPFTSGRLRGVNVAGLLDGTDPELKREVVVVCAHHDHLGMNESGIHNGADDNASGVAMLLELARAAAYLPRKRSVLFVSFDAEEVGLLGSRAFVRSGPFDPGSFAALICLDLVGGDYYPGDDRGLYALGAESSPELDRLVRSEAAIESELQVKPIGIYAIEPMGPILARSDYASFRSARVPFVFFSTGTPWYYHTPHDDPERINYDKLLGNARFVLRILAALCDDPGRPTFEPDPPTPAGDARLFAGELEKILAVPDLPFEAGERDRLAAALAELRQEQDPAADKKVRGLVQRSMMILFGVIQRYRPPR